MKYFYSPSGQSYAYEEDGSQDSIIPADFIPATEEQVYALLHPVIPSIDSKVAIQEQIDTLERQQLLPRITREFMLLQFVNVATASGVDPTTNVAYVKLKEFNDTIAALRAKL